MSIQVMNPNLVEADWEIESEVVRPSDGANEKAIETLQTEIRLKWGPNELVSCIRTFVVRVSSNGSKHRFLNQRDLIGMLGRP
jgi:hypothetical protein